MGKSTRISASMLSGLSPFPSWHRAHTHGSLEAWMKASGPHELSRHACDQSRLLFLLNTRKPPTGHPSACRSKLAGRNEDFAVREMCEAPVMIHVQMGEDDPFHIARPDTERPQLRSDFFFTVDSKLNFPSDIGMKGGPGFEQMRSLAGVDDNDTFSMLDNPYVCGQPFGPVLISEDCEPSSRALRRARSLSGRNRSGSHAPSWRQSP
jgi:hypothetical protein